MPIQFPIVVDCPVALDAEPALDTLTITWHCPACGCDSYEEVKRTGEQAATLPTTASYTVTCDDCEEKRMARLRACNYQPLYDEVDPAQSLKRGFNPHVFKNRLDGKVEMPPERPTRNRIFP